ncbi:hypothetical protein D3C85_1254350 [compost metagenome]
MRIVKAHVIFIKFNMLRFITVHAWRKCFLAENIFRSGTRRFVFFFSSSIQLPGFLNVDLFRIVILAIQQRSVAILGTVYIT